jgi:Membrane-bound serine protease (ClpP class)
MKRAERLEIRSGALQREIRTDDVDDIVPGGDLFDCFWWNCHRETGKLIHAWSTWKMKMFAISICLAFVFGVAAPLPRANYSERRRRRGALAGEVAPSLLAFLRRAVKTAESNDASAIVFDMNTYGGRLDTATEIVTRSTKSKSRPTRLLTRTQDRPARSLSSPRNTFTWRRWAQLARLHRSFRRAKICPPRQRKKRFRIGLHSSEARPSRTAIIPTSPRHSWIKRRK